MCVWRTAVDEQRCIPSKFHWRRIEMPGIAWRAGKLERERQRHTHTHTERERERERESATEAETDRKRQREREREQEQERDRPWTCEAIRPPCNPKPPRLHRANTKNPKINK